jgi:hypothetical protein
MSCFWSDRLFTYSGFLAVGSDWISLLKKLFPCGNTIIGLRSTHIFQILFLLTTEGGSQSPHLDCSRFSFIYKGSRPVCSLFMVVINDLFIIWSPSAFLNDGVVILHSYICWCCLSVSSKIFPPDIELVLIVAPLGTLKSQSSASTSQ